MDRARRAVRLIVALVILAAPAIASAYPQFQLAMGVERCSGCHLSPAGGGLLGEYGREESADSISRGGDGRFLHGLWTPPDWLALGGDFRYALAGKVVAERRDLLAFPMQGDLYLRATRGSFAFAFTAGVRAAPRDPAPVLIERLASREHYVAYTHGDDVVRVGRFFPVFGLRLADHTAYTRRYLGMNLLEEPYALEVARERGANEVHVAAFVPQPIALLGSGFRASGVAALAERSLDATIVGAQARVAIGNEESRYTLGAVGKHWMPDAHLLWLGELDVQRETFVHGPAREQVAAYFGVFQWLARGVVASSALHLWDPDLALARDSRHAFELSVQYFPRAHFEAQAMARVTAEGNDYDDPGYLALLQLHYYP
jgi:hypothetical protein